jgi:multidrug efflux system membrane fusion protein
VVITQVRPISVVFTLPADALPGIRQAIAAGLMRATALDREGAHALAEGTLAVVDNEIDQATGSLRLKATFPNEDGALWPGQFVTVRLLLRTDHGVRAVPSGAIQRGPDGMWVYVVRPDQTVGAQPVQVRRFAAGLAVLNGGLEPGATVVTAGQYRLAPGARVAVAQAPAAAPPAAGS